MAMASRPRARKARTGSKESRDAGRGAAIGDSLAAYMREIAKFEPLPSDEEKSLGRKIQAGDEAALNKLVESNLRFVVSYAKRYRGLGLSFLDLIHEGNLGLIEAAKRFDPERNVRFISYAVWWVRQAIFHGLAEHSRMFRLPEKVSGQVSKVGSVRDRLAAELERQPTNEEVAKEAELTEADVERLLRVAGEGLSLSTEVGEDGNMELGDLIEQDTIPPIEIEMIRDSFTRQIKQLLEVLDDKEREVMRMRFGLDGEDPRNLREIGESLGLSRERVRQIESKAKEKLRRNETTKGLRGYLT
jgi:RNA polymerase primary sigma factor